MSPSHLVAVLGTTLLVFTVLFADPPTKSDPVRATLYHPDPDHPWNRLHDALFVRVGPDGIAYGRDRLEPLLWNDSRHLLEGKSHDAALALLEEVRTATGAKWMADPLKRAVLQRDLWLVYNWLVRDGQSKDDRLGVALAKVIARLALTPKEIRDLPDNYASAVAAGAFAKGYDPAKPNADYLPADLFKEDGPWVGIGRTDRVSAPQHLAEGATNQFTNSVFLTFLRLPGGRAATVEFLKRLTTFAGPLMVRNPDDGSRGSAPFVPPQELPLRVTPIQAD